MLYIPKLKNYKNKNALAHLNLSTAGFKCMIYRISVMLIMYNISLLLTLSFTSAYTTFDSLYAVLLTSWYLTSTANITACMVAKGYVNVGGLGK